MATVIERPLEERILELLQHLGLRRAHFAGRGAADWSGLVTNHPEVVASLTLVCPLGMNPDLLAPIASRLLVFAADQGPGAQAARYSVQGFSDARLSILQNYVSLLWADVVADRNQDLGTAMLDFLTQMGQETAIEPVTFQGKEGEVAGISYRIQGSGSPLVLLPLALAPSQWEPILPCLSQRYCTITLRGSVMGWASVFEARGRSGYGAVVRSLIDETELQPGEGVLEVGCGTGFASRLLAQRAGGANRMTAVDVSPYLLGEAVALARREGVSVEFREGNALALAFPDNSFDLTFSVTVMEEVNADQMLRELVRVTKPGGRVAVIVRAEDLPFHVNLKLRPELKAKVEAPGGARPGAVEGGCADSSLYQRFCQAGLTEVKMFPQLSASGQGQHRQTLVGQIMPALSSTETQEWQTAVQQAGETFFISHPLHCAVGRKPE